MSRRVLVVLLTISTVVNMVAIFTFGFYWRETTRRPPHLPPPGQSSARLEELQKRFKLTADQMDTMRVLDQAMRSGLRPLRSELPVRADSLMLLLQAPELDRAALDRQIRELDLLKIALDHRVVEAVLRLRAVLDPEQRRELGELFEELRRSALPNMPAGAPPGAGFGPGPAGGPPPDRPGPGRRGPR